MSTSFVSLDFSDLDAVRPQVEGLIADPSAAIVLMGTELGEEDYALFANAAAHLIVLDGWSDRQYFDAVVIANTDSVLRAVDYLIEKGHKQIGYLAGDLRIRNFKDRERGYRQALEDADLEANPTWRVTLGTTLEGAYRDMGAWLDSVSRDDLPTAFFAENDVLAVGAMRALNEHGIRVPEDVSIIGFDDLSLGRPSPIRRSPRCTFPSTRWARSRCAAWWATSAIPRAIPARRPCRPILSSAKACVRSRQRQRWAVGRQSSLRQPYITLLREGPLGPLFDALVCSVCLHTV